MLPIAVLAIACRLSGESNVGAIVRAAGHPVKEAKGPSVRVVR
jgi:hypothetical protein